MANVFGRTLVVRADGNSYIGSGHLMRCLALAQAWQDAGGRAVFVTSGEASPIEDRLKLEGVDVLHLRAEPGTGEDASETASLALKLDAAWIVLDGYHFSDGYQEAIKCAHRPLVIIDDNGHSQFYHGDIVLNQNIHAEPRLYLHRDKETCLLLGTRYALLRREFLRWQGWKRQIRKIGSKVLVTMGGADPWNATMKVIHALQRVEVRGLEVVAVAGSSNPHIEQLQSVVRDSPVSMRLEHNVSNMPDLMIWADIAVSGAGSTCWEMAYLGLPSILLVLAENQRSVAERLAIAGLALNLGWNDRVTESQVANAVTDLLNAPARRRHMSRAGTATVDGMGRERVVSVLTGKLPFRVEDQGGRDVC